MILLERCSKPWVAFIICAPWTSKARMPWAWGSWNSKHMTDMVWYGHLENYHRVKVCITESRLTSPQQVHPTRLICVPCRISLRGEQFGSICAHERQKCMSQWHGNTGNTGHSASGDQWRHCTVAPCCVLRVLWQSEPGHKKPGQFGLANSSSKVAGMGRIWTHLVWKEQSEDHSVSSVWDWDCASVVWFARRDCWHLLTGTVSQCNSVTVLHLSSCASIPLRQHSWQQHSRFLWCTFAIFCQAYNPWLIDHDWRDGSDVARVNMLKSLTDYISQSILQAYNCCEFWYILLQLSQQTVDWCWLLHDSMQPQSWKHSLSALISQAGCRLDVDLQCGQTCGSPSHWWHHGVIQNHAQLDQ